MRADEAPVVEFQFACDKEVWIQDMLQHSLGCNTVFADIDDMGGATAFDTVTMHAKAIPAVDLDFTGWVCVDGSILNPSRKDKLQCMAEQTGASGGSFHGYQKFMGRHKPILGIGENVPWPN
jgi:hypothetical protein